jgi:hypothetical protein
MHHISICALSIVTLAVFRTDVESRKHTPDHTACRAPVHSACEQGETDSCSGCIATVEILADAPVAVCADGSPGATITHTDESSGGGECTLTWNNKPCSVSGKCWIKKRISILISQPACRIFYIEGPGITGRTALADSIDLGHFTDEAACSNADEKSGAGVTFRVFDAATGGNLLASYGWRAKCSKCARTPN